jgi:DNA topoisomerase IA
MNKLKTDQASSLKESSIAPTYTHPSQHYHNAQLIDKMQRRHELEETP